METCFCLLFVLTNAVETNTAMHVPKDLLPNVPKVTKVAVIDVGHVFDYFLEKRYGAELKKIRTAYFATAEKVRDSNSQNVGHALLVSEFHEISRNLETTEKRIYLELRKDVDFGIRKIAEAYGFQIVLGYRAPKESDWFASKRRSKEPIIEETAYSGAIVPLHIDGSVNITWAVIRVAARSGEMERWEKEEQKRPSNENYENHRNPFRAAHHRRGTWHVHSVAVGSRRRNFTHLNESRRRQDGASA